MSDDAQTAAAYVLNRHPGLRERIADSAEFQTWRAAHRALEVDGTTYFVAPGGPLTAGGDRLRDEDELMLEWARQTKFVYRAGEKGGRQAAQDTSIHRQRAPELRHQEENP